MSAVAEGIYKLIKTNKNVLNEMKLKQPKTILRTWKITN